MIAECVLRINRVAPLRSSRAMHLTPLVRMASRLMLVCTIPLIWLGNLAMAAKTQVIDFPPINNQPYKNLFQPACISGGGDHGLIVMTTGTLWAMGDNTYGQLGIGNKINQNRPKQVTTGVKSASAGGAHSLILKQDGSVQAMGWNLYGQLGNGGNSDKTSPANTGITNVKQVSAGLAHSIFLKNDLTAWTCGFNSNGQLSNGTTNNRNRAAQVMSNVIQVSAGGTHSLYLKSDGTAWASGDNSAGQLGITNQGFSITTPQHVLSDVIQISAGFEHSLFLKKDGSVWAAGRGGSGQLATGNIVDQSTPVRVMTGVRQISAGGSHSLFLKADDSLWSVGSNEFGQLGIGKSSVLEFTPTQVLTGVFAISANGDNSICITRDGSVWVAGSNSSGQLGDGGTLNQPAFERVFDAYAATQVSLTATASSTLPVTYQIVSGPATVTGSILTLTGEGEVVVRATQAGNTTYAAALPVTQTFTATRVHQTVEFPPIPDQSLVVHTRQPAISIGPAHTLFLKSDGSVWAVGENGDGRLATGDTINRSTPEKVMDDVAQISAGGAHSLFLKLDGTVWGAGGNIQGELGIGSKTLKNTPVRIMISDVKAVSAGSSYSLFLKMDGSVWACGSSWDGVFGNGSQIGSLDPIMVAQGAVAIKADSTHSLLLKNDGVAWATGRNVYGVLGVGDRTDRTSWVPVISGVSKIASSRSSSMFLKSDGSVWACGDNASGQLGIGNYTRQLSPVMVMTDARSIAPGVDHSLFLKMDGTVMAAGANTSNQIDALSPNYLPTPVQVMSGVASIEAADEVSFYTKLDGLVLGAGQRAMYQFGTSIPPPDSPPFEAFQSYAFTTIPLTASTSSELQASFTVNSGPGVIRANSVTLTGEGEVTIGAIQEGNIVFAPSAVETRTFRSSKNAQAIEFPELGNLTLKPTGRNQAMSQGGDFSLFLKSDGSAWAAGSNYRGQMGEGSALGQSQPKNIMNQVAQVSAGYSHSVILKNDGSAWMLGGSAPGSPVKVMDHVVSISAGSSHSLFLTHDGNVWALGENLSGQLGIGSYVAQQTPVWVMNGVAAISAGHSHSLFLKVDGTVWGAGSNTYGQLGTGDLVNRFKPDRCLIGQVSQVSAGGLHSLFLKTDGSLWGAGLNYNGEISGSKTFVSLPIRMADNVQSMSAGLSHSIVLKADGSALACGYNEDGRLGVIYPGNYRELIPIMNGVEAVDAGHHTSMFLRTDGEIYAAGTNTSGMLGTEPNSTSTPAKVAEMIDPITIPLAARATSALPVTYSCLSGPATVSFSSLTATGPGDVEIVANQPGNRVFAPAAPANRTLRIHPSPGPNLAQTITFMTPPSVYKGALPIPLFAYSSSGLPVHFQVVSGPARTSGCSVELNDGVGTVVVRATQEGNASFMAAPPVECSFVVEDPSIRYSAWTQASGLSAATSGPLTIPHKDGVSNLMKYAFNMDATKPDCRMMTPGGDSGLPLIQRATNGNSSSIKLVFVRRKNSGLIYTPEKSLNLTQFSALDCTESLTPLDSVWERVVLIADLPTTPSKAFYRVRVALP